ncbi:MAG: MBL fold metallo-hydrolase [bacterium]|nr:MBL fold metallo-hydrolase [bacterium]
MEFSYLGHSAFKLKGKTATLVTDPYDAKVGKFPKDTTADIVTVSHDHFDHNQVKLISGSPFVIDSAGEYEVKGVSVVGVGSWHDNSGGSERGANVLYVIEMDGLRICHAGDLGHKLTDPQLEALGSLDIVLLPVGGTFTLDAKQAAEVVQQLDPWIVIPMHHQQPGLDSAAFGKLAEVDVFLKELGKTVTPVPKLVMSRDKLPTELQVVVLERK